MSTYADETYAEQWMAEFAAEADARPTWHIGDTINVTYTTVSRSGYHTADRDTRITAIRPNGHSFEYMTDAINLWFDQSVVRPQQRPTPARWGRRTQAANVW